MRVLFGLDAEGYEEAARQFRKLWGARDAEKGKPGRKPAAKPLALPGHSYERSGLELALLPPALDAVLETSDLVIERIEFGQGCRIETIPAADFAWLPAGARIAEVSGRAAATTQFVPPGLHLGSQSRSSSVLFLPRQIRVVGARPDTTWEVQLYVVTDTSYPSGSAQRGQAAFELPGIVGLGGIAAFVDRWGNFRRSNGVEIGGGLGCAAVFTVVAFAHGVPCCRTPYFVGVRRGIRYPDDVWLSKGASRPVSSRPDALDQGRFVFQSWEVDGGSRDLFVADFNGERLCNLNRDDGAALEGFEDDDGNEIVAWLDDGRIQFASNASGKGFSEVMVRNDCLAYRGSY